MRVLFTISELTFGGAQKQVIELARQLVRHGHDAAIYTLNADVPRARELDGSGVDLVVDQKKRKLDPGVLWRLRRFIADWRPDILHGFLFDGDIYARLAAFGTGLPVLNSERSDNYRLSRLQYLTHRATRALADGLSPTAIRAVPSRNASTASRPSAATWCGTACAPRSSSARPRAAPATRPSSSAPEP